MKYPNLWSICNKYKKKVWLTIYTIQWYQFIKGKYDLMEMYFNAMFHVQQRNNTQSAFGVMIFFNELMTAGVISLYYILLYYIILYT